MRRLRARRRFPARRRSPAGHAAAAARIRAASPRILPSTPSISPSTRSTSFGVSDDRRILRGEACRFDQQVGHRNRPAGPAPGPGARRSGDHPRAATDQRRRRQQRATDKGSPDPSGHRNRADHCCHRLIAGPGRFQARGHGADCGLVHALLTASACEIAAIGVHLQIWLRCWSTTSSSSVRVPAGRRPPSRRQSSARRSPSSSAAGCSAASA